MPPHFGFHVRLLPQHRAASVRRRVAQVAVPQFNMTIADMLQHLDVIEDFYERVYKQKAQLENK